MKRHKHADIIHAYAEGAEVQVREDFAFGPHWHDLTYPSFNPSYQYRIKPDEPQSPKALITEEQRKALRLLCPKYRWLAMDMTGDAWVYTEAPKEGVDHWMNDGCDVDMVPLDGYAPNWRESLVDLTKEIHED